MKTRIVVVTDCKDIASMEIRATLISVLEELGKDQFVVIEPFAFCKEFSVVNCAFIIRLLAESYSPKNTVFLVIANALPTSRANRARLVGCTKNGFRFVAENTGALSWLLKDFGIKELYEFSSHGLDGQEFISFGGKYIHAPQAAVISAGAELSSRSENSFSVSQLAKCDIPNGMIVHIDNFGVAKCKIELPSVKEGDIFHMFVNGKSAVDTAFTHSMKNLPDNTWAIYKGSSFGLFEIGCVRNIHSSSNIFQIEDTITLQRR